MSWNLADILETVASALPGHAPALVYGERTVSWADLDRRSNALARQLLARGLSAGDKVAFYLRNQPAYLETLVACLKARLVLGDVFFVSHPPRSSAKFDSCQAYQPVHISFPQSLGCLGFSRLQLRNPVCHGIIL